MRCLVFILTVAILGSCGNKMDSFKYAGEKVVQTVSVCTEAAKNVCNEAGNSLSSPARPYKEQVEADIKASGGWDTRMMLW